MSIMIFEPRERRMGDRRSNTISKGLAVMATGFMVWWAWVTNQTPEIVKTGVLVISLLLLIDTVSGITVACMEKRVRSRTMRERTTAKLVSYSCMFALGIAVSAFTKNWFLIEAVQLAIMGMEAVSILENMRRLESIGKVNFGPAAPLLRWLAQFLEVPETTELPGDKNPDDKTTL